MKLKRRFDLERTNGIFADLMRSFLLYDIATLYGDVGDEEERLAFLDKVFEMGCTFWDTAEVCCRLCGLLVLCCVVLWA